MSSPLSFSLSLDHEWRDGYGGAMAYHRDGKEWASGRAGLVHLWHEESLHQTVPLPGYGATPLCFSADGQWLFAGGYHIARGSDMAHPLPTLAQSLVAALPASQPPDAFEISGAVWQEEGNRLAIAASYRPPRGLRQEPPYPGPEQRLLLLDGETGALQRVLWEGQALSPPTTLLLTEEWLAAAGLDITIWRVADGQPLATLRGHQAGVRALALAPGGQQLASSDAAGEVRLWQVEGWQPVAAWQAHMGAATSLAFNPSLPLLATGGEDGFVRFWSHAATPQSLLELPQPDRVEGLAFDPGGLRLLVASRFRGQQIRRYSLR